MGWLRGKWRHAPSQSIILCLPAISRPSVTSHSSDSTHALKSGQSVISNAWASQGNIRTPVPLVVTLFVVAWVSRARARVRSKAVQRNFCTRRRYTLRDKIDRLSSLPIPLALYLFVNFALCAVMRDIAIFNPSSRDRIRTIARNYSGYTPPHLLSYLFIYLFLALN